MSSLDSSESSYDRLGEPDNGTRGIKQNNKLKDTPDILSFRGLKTKGSCPVVPRT